MPLYVPATRRITGTSSTANSATFTTTALTLLTLTVTIPSGRRYRFTAVNGLGCASTVANDVYQLAVQNGATVLGQSRGNCGPVINTANDGAVVVADLVGTGVSVSITLTVVRGVGTGTLTCFANVNSPLMFYVDDVGT